MNIQIHSVQKNVKSLDKKIDEKVDSLDQKME